MSNPVKGEVTFEVSGKTYTLKFGTNAMALVEDRLKTSWPKLVARAEDWGVKESRVLLWAGLHQHHQMTEQEVGDLIDEIGPDEFGALLLKAFDAANPKKEGAKGSARPPKAGTGTGS